MERNTVTTIDRLKAGDRFYKAHDKKKELWTVVQHKTKTTKYQTYRFWAQKDGQRHPEPINKSLVIVFMRHAPGPSVDGLPLEA